MHKNRVIKVNKNKFNTVVGVTLEFKEDKYIAPPMRYGGLQLEKYGATLIDYHAVPYSHNNSTVVYINTYTIDKPKFNNEIMDNYLKLFTQKINQLFQE